MIRRTPLRSNPPSTLHKADERSRFGFLYERDVFDFFMEHGIHVSDYEEPFEVCVDEHGDIIGASTFGCRHEEDEGCLEYSFSVAVDPDARRSGVARRLVQSIIDQHPGIYLSPWVVNPHMALLLESMGFEADGEWSQDTPYMSLWTPVPRANGARPNMRRLKGYRDHQGQDDRYYLQQYKSARHLAAKLQRVVKDDVMVEIYPKKPIGGSFVMLVVGNGRGAEINMQLVRREATDERDDSRRWRDWTLTPRGPKDRWVRGNFEHVSKALMKGLQDMGLLRPRSNISFDEWTRREARRTIDQAPPALSKGQAPLRRAAALGPDLLSGEAPSRRAAPLGPDLFSGPLLERPEIKFARQQVAKGLWPYGSLDGIIARVVGAAVEALDGNVRAASRALDISHTTTMRWLKTYRELVEAGKLPEPRPNRLLTGQR